MARSEIDTVKLWIANHTGRPYEEYDENTVMVDTDYCGLYPSRETLAVQVKIKAYIRRHHPSIHVESRGCYTGLLIEAQKEAALAR